MTSPAVKASSAAAVCAANEALALEIDAFVMAVTESLCLFEKNSPVMAQQANRARRARILALLGDLDAIVCALRETSASEGAPALPSRRPRRREGHEEAGRAA